MPRCFSLINHLVEEMYWGRLSPHWHPGGPRHGDGDGGGRAGDGGAGPEGRERWWEWRGKPLLGPCLVPHML